MHSYRFAILNAILLAALVGSHFGRRIEGAHISQENFLKTLPLPFRGWTATDVNLEKSDLDLLQPDATIVRRYVAPKTGENAEIAVIAGHRKKSVHTPGFCMIGDGWEMLEQRNYDLHVGDRTIPAIRSVMLKEKKQLITTYFFTDGEYCTNNLLKFQGTQLLRRFKSEMPIGALVRTIVVVQTTKQAAEQLSDEFAEATVPPVMKSLRDVKLKIE